MANPSKNDFDVLQDSFLEPLRVDRSCIDGDIAFAGNKRDVLPQNSIKKEQFWIEQNTFFRNNLIFYNPLQTGLAAIGDDVVGIVASYLPFSTIAMLSSTSSSMRACLSHRLWIKLFVERNDVSLPIDSGTGARVAFPLNHPKWKCMMLARERAQRLMHADFERIDGGSRITSLLSRMQIRMDHSSHYQQDCFDVEIVEGLRLIVETFECQGAVGCSCCCIDGSVLQALLAFLSYRISDQEVAQLGAKVIGILGLCEENRVHLPSLGACDIVVKSMRMHESSDGDVLCNALWSLVILSRPLGSVEGGRYRNHESTLGHISEILGNSRAVDAVTRIAKQNQEPRILAKAFWAMVNLSLNTPCKEAIISRGSLEDIVSAMKRYENHVDLQHRALFALVNLSIRTNAKRFLREIDGLVCIINALSRFSDYQPLIQCAAVLINSLSWHDQQNRTIFRYFGACELIECRLMSTRLLPTVRSDLIRAVETLRIDDH